MQRHRSYSSLAQLSTSKYKPRYMAATVSCRMKQTDNRLANKSKPRPPVRPQPPAKPRSQRSRLLSARVPLKSTYISPNESSILMNSLEEHGAPRRNEFSPNYYASASVSREKLYISREKPTSSMLRQTREAPMGQVSYEPLEVPGGSVRNLRKTSYQRRELSGDSVRDPSKAAHLPKELYGGYVSNPHNHMINAVRKYINEKSSNKGSMFSFNVNNQISDSFQHQPLEKETVVSFDTNVRRRPSQLYKKQTPSYPFNVPADSIKERYSEDQPSINHSIVAANAKRLSDQKRPSPSIKEVLKKLNDKVNKLYS